MTKEQMNSVCEFIKSIEKDAMFVVLVLDETNTFGYASNMTDDTAIELLDEASSFVDSFGKSIIYLS